MHKVLIVDDAAFMRMALRLLLEDHDFEVVGEAEDGRSAVQQYMLCKPDLVTMDITMRDMNGIEALKAIREYDPKAKVVMVSAMGQECLVKEAVLNGARSFIIKPYKERQMVETLTKIASIPT